MVVEAPELPPKRAVEQAAELRDAVECNTLTRLVRLSTQVDLKNLKEEIQKKVPRRYEDMLA